MRAVICFSVFLCAVVCQNVNNMSALPKYDERYAYLDVDAIFSNKRLIRNYVDCLINSNRCTPEGKALKSKLFLFIKQYQAFFITNLVIKKSLYSVISPSVFLRGRGLQT